VIAHDAVERGRVRSEELEVERRRVNLRGVARDAEWIRERLVRLARAVERERPGVFVPVGVDRDEIGREVVQVAFPVQLVHAKQAADRQRAVLLGGRGARE